MIPNFSDTAGYDQILKQMMYEEKKVKKKGELVKERERKERKNEGARTITIDISFLNLKN